MVKIVEKCKRESARSKLLLIGDIKLFTSLLTHPNLKKFVIRRIKG